MQFAGVNSFFGSMSEIDDESYDKTICGGAN